ncbi:MAG: DUF3095 family protein [Roseiarcus sp.]|uniref:DUF3095 family protein n=1 Tax=Roseiarcus sp. TaxID=1969460 RepID=UPI003BAE844E
MTSDATDFYASLPVFDNFAEAVKAKNYRPLPDDWVIGFSDVVGSTQAIANGRYKAVNMVGAGVIASVANALGRRPFPFIFGGDGASFAVSPSEAPAAAQALAAMAAFAHAEFELDLRIATIPVRQIRAAARDVRVARFAVSEHCNYAMFAGGGLSWFEERAKRGEFALPHAPDGALPDLSGLSCRWGVAPAKYGLVLSVIVSPRGDDPRYPALVDEVVQMVLGAAQSGRPITVESLGVGAAGQAIALEACAVKASGVSRLRAQFTAATNYLMGLTFHKLKLKAGGFDAALYAAEVAANADFRKFDDGLRMTLDCAPAFADALEARLAAADDFADWGVFRQKSAQITCFVPSINEHGHVHFVDGAEGGYTMAATALKARRLLKAEAA